MSDIITDPPVTIREQAGRSGRNQAQSNAWVRSFLVRGTTDPIVARQKLVDNSVALNLEVFDGLVLDSLEWALVGDAGPDNWTFTANYADVPEPGGYTISMDTSGGTVKTTDAFAQQAFPATGQTAPNFATSINVKNDGTVEGVDRVIGALKLNVNAKIASRWVTDPIGYSKTVASVTGFVNSTVYLGFQPGELLFLGASGEIVGDNPTLTYTFEASQNATGLTIGNIPNITKGGHQYIWFTYREDKDPNISVPVTSARAAYVSTIYGGADFSVLRIGEP